MSLEITEYFTLKNSIVNFIFFPREVNNNILFYLKKFANKLFLFVSAEKSDDLDQSKVERVLFLIGKLATNSNPTF